MQAHADVGFMDREQFQKVFDELDKDRITEVKPPPPSPGVFLFPASDSAVSAASSSSSVQQRPPAEAAAALQSLLPDGAGERRGAHQRHVHLCKYGARRRQRRRRSVSPLDLLQTVLVLNSEKTTVERNNSNLEVSSPRPEADRENFPAAFRPNRDPTRPHGPSSRTSCWSDSEQPGLWGAPP